MKRAFYEALGATLGLLVLAGILIGTAVYYGSVALWAGGLAALAQMIPVALACWGLRLADHRQTVADYEPAGSPHRDGGDNPFGQFRMGFSDDTGAAPVDRPRIAPGALGLPEEPAKTLDIGFQRICVALAGVAMFAVAAVLIWMVRSQYAAVGPGQTIIIAARALDAGAIVAGLLALFGYGVLYSATRVTPETRGYGEAVNSLMLLGLPVGALVAGAMVCGWAGVTYAAQVAAVAIAILIALQGLELLVNAVKSYAPIEELDHHGTDLNTLPLAPMVASGWIDSFRILLGQSVGLRRRGQTTTGVMARMLPRVFAAIVLGLVLVSMLRIVPTGMVAIREHLGWADQATIDHPLQPGLHIMWPWPIDQLVDIPTLRVQHLMIGTEQEARNSQTVGANSFELWSNHTTTPGNDFLTGDVNYLTGQPSPKMVGGFISIWWRVKNASDFYQNVSHSAFVQSGGRTGLANKKEQLPIYDSMVQQVGLYAVTRAVALHSLSYTMATGKAAAENQTRRIMQKELNAMKTGIHVVDVAFVDMHPPSSPKSNTASGPSYGPAQAYEEVINAREHKERVIDQARMMAFREVEEAKGQATADILNADAYSVNRVNVETGKANALVARSDAFVKDQQTAKVFVLYQVLKKVFKHVTKVVLGPRVAPPTLWQLNPRGGISAMNSAPMPPRR